MTHDTAQVMRIHLRQWLRSIATVVLLGPIIVAVAAWGWTPVPRAAPIVALGDSITIGYHLSSPGQPYPTILTQRLGLPIVNAGISGNAVAIQTPLTTGTPMVTRLDADVFSVRGVRVLLLLGGVNDLRGGGNAPEVITGLRTIIQQVHAHHVRVLLGTILPFGTCICWTAAAEQGRTAVNAWIRASHTADSVVDFDAVMRDPQQADWLAPAYDNGDGLHPNGAGYRTMANAVPLALLRRWVTAPAD